MNNILNFDKERYSKIIIYSNDNNHSNDYAIIVYNTYLNGKFYEEKTKKIPVWMIKQAINEFEYQKGGKLKDNDQIIMMRIMDDSKVYKESINEGKKTQNQPKIKKRNVIRIVLIGMTISVLAKVGYSLSKSSIFKGPTNYTINYDENIFGDEMNELYLSQEHPEKDAIIGVYEQYRNTANEILSGKFSKESIDKYINYTDILVSNDLFINIPGFINYIMTPYSMDISTFQLSNNDLFQTVSSKTVDSNIKKYMEEQCKYLFYDSNKMIPNSGIDMQMKDFYKIPNIDSENIDESYLLSQLTSLIQLRKYVENEDYTFITKNNSGVSKSFAGKNEILDTINKKIEDLTVYLKNKSIKENTNHM